METWLRIGELAAQVGMSTNAIRFYERVGLLDPPRRAPNGYRVYDAAAVRQLQFIRRAKLLGLSLEEIKLLFETAKSGRSARRCHINLLEVGFWVNQLACSQPAHLDCSGRAGEFQLLLG